MLQNEYLLAKIGVDPAENEPSKDLAPPTSTGRLAARRTSLAGGITAIPRAVDYVPLMASAIFAADLATADLATTHHSFLSSFSAISKRNFATKYAFWHDFAASFKIYKTI